MPTLRAGVARYRLLRVVGMTKTGPTDEIDTLVALVRDMVAQKHPAAVGLAAPAAAPLVLTADLRVDGRATALRAAPPTTPIAEQRMTHPHDQVSPPANDQGAADSAALRELMALMIRQELAGETGAAMTRALRKMIRREIDLALAARDSD